MHSKIYESNTMEIYFSLTPKLKQTLQPSSTFWLLFLLRAHHHLGPEGQTGKRIGGRTAAPLEQGEPPPLASYSIGWISVHGHTHLQGKLGNVVWLCLSKSIYQHFISSPCATARLHLSLKAPCLFFHRAFA